MQDINPQQIKDQINHLLEHEVDRKQFLKHVGIGLVAITGAVSAFKVLNQLSRPIVAEGSSYGTSSYGGRRPARLNR